MDEKAKTDLFLNMEDAINIYGPEALSSVKEQVSTLSPEEIEKIATTKLSYGHIPVEELATVSVDFIENILGFKPIETEHSHSYVDSNGDFSFAHENGNATISITPKDKPSLGKYTQSYIDEKGALHLNETQQNSTDAHIAKDGTLTIYKNQPSSSGKQR